MNLLGPEDIQLENYIVDMWFDEQFCALKGINRLAEKLVNMKKHIMYPLVYLLLKLTLILFTITIMIERDFSTINLIENAIKWVISRWMIFKLHTLNKNVFDTIGSDIINDIIIGTFLDNETLLRIIIIWYMFLIFVHIQI